MSDLKEIILMDGEQILHKMEGDAYNNDPNPIMKLLGKVDKVLSKLYGKSQKVYFVQTTHRILLVEKGMIFWKFPRDIVSKALSKDAIDTVGYTQARRWLVFKSLYFNLSLRSGQSYEIQFDGKLADLALVANDINNGIFAHKTHLKAVA